MLYLLGLRTSEDYRFYTASASFPEFSNKEKTLVVQYSVKHEQSLDCGGAYVKVYPAGTEQEHLHGDSKYKYVFELRFEAFAFDTLAEAFKGLKSVDVMGPNL